MSISPRLVKGALVRGSDELVAFQYNPETIVRRLSASGGEVRETIDFTLVLDESVAARLASLELLLCPPDEPRLFESGAGAGVNVGASVNIGAGAGMAPDERLHLVLGPHRVVPVELVAMVVVEELFSPELEPLRATVALTADGVESLPARRQRLAGSLDRHG